MLALTDRIYPVLQLTRAALVFTAISNSFAELLLRSRWAERLGVARGGFDPGVEHFAAILLVSVGLYGYGMSLNDIIDRRRDEQIAADRPLPSGRVGIVTAHVICALLAVMALAGGAWYASLVGLADPAGAWMSLALVVWTALLITFYDAAGKYLVWPGLITLGLVRLFHAVIPAPQVPLVWHPLVLFNHVTILSAVAYVWEEKRPALTRAHRWGVVGGTLVLNAALIATVAWRRTRQGHGLIDGLWIEPALLAPLAAAAGFVILAFFVRGMAPGPRQAGRSIMLYGLLWLIVYDAAFVAAYVGLLPGLLLLLLLPVAYLSVQVMRAWGRVLSLSQRPAFKRAE